MNNTSVDWLKNNFGTIDKISKKMMSSIPAQVIDDIKKELELVPEYETIRHVIYCISHGVALRKCATCGKVLTYSKSFIFNCQYCSYACIDNKRRTSKLKDAIRKKYGIDNPSQLDAVKEKKKQTSLKHYGTFNVFQSEEVKAIQKKTCFERYGVENVFQNEDIKKKLKETNQSRYGCVNAMQNKGVKEKLKHSCFEKYGVVNPSQNEEVKKKRNNTCVERFGTDNIFKNKLFIRKQLDRTYENFKKRWKDYVIPMFPDKDYWGAHHVYKWKCVKCGDEFEQEIYTTEFSDIDRYVPRCWKCHPKCSGFSNEEKEVAEYVKSIYDGRVVENDRSVINPFELDIYLPDKRLAIEFDGFYWHSDASGTDSGYHLLKTEQCELLGIHLVHIFENEWLINQKIVKDRIRSILGIGQRRIFARKCSIQEISSFESEEFLDANHLHGSCHDAVRYGLYHDGELVSVMTFGKPRFNKNYDYELLRFASKIGCNVVGGAGKLLAEFRKSYRGSIISYADRRYSMGNLYEKLGFVKSGISKPNYVWTKRGNALTRYQCQKHRLAKVLGDGFDATKTEVENMEHNGWIRVFDCGNIVYAMN